MPVTGLPVAVEAVLESLLSQYHLVSWQVTGGERSVVLTLRWSLGAESDHPHRSPARTPPARRRSPHRHRHQGRARRTSQWLLDQQQETPDSTLDRPDRHRNSASNSHCNATSAASPPVTRREYRPDRTDGGAGSEGYDDDDSDPPPLPPPPPLPEFSDGTGSGSCDPASESEADSRTTQETVIENRNRKPVFREDVEVVRFVEVPERTARNRTNINNHDTASSYDEDSLGRKGKGGISKRIPEPEPGGILKKQSVTVYEKKPVPPDKDVHSSKGQGEGSEESDGRKKRYHFRELIRKHSEEIKQLAAERRRKERERQRLREQEKVKAKARLKAQSEDNLLTRDNLGEQTTSDENLRAKSEASIPSKNDDGARRVRFSEAGAIHTISDAEEGETGTLGTEEGRTQKGEEFEGDVIEEEEEEAGGGDDDDDDEGDSSDAEEIGQHVGPRRIGAVFRIGTMLARQRRRRKLVD